MMRQGTFQPAAALLLSLVSIDRINAHGYHPKASDLIPEPDWATIHMQGLCTEDLLELISILPVPLPF
jgi:hypothetical protein